MNRDFPIFTQLRACHDCYKCVRRCPAKAIRVKDGSASVIAERCVSCGECVLVCPAKAKRIRQDVPGVKNVLRRQRLAVSLAPSWVSCFSQYSYGQLVAALQLLGFEFCEETAVGADWVSEQTVAQLKSGKPGIYLSTACPSAVEFMRLFLPDHAPHLMTLPSPALAHARLLKQRHGHDLGVVFIGPCAAKKREADHSVELTAALTFDELQEWFNQENINPLELAPAEVAEHAGIGVVYPMEGGMLKTLQNHQPDLVGVTVSGLNSIWQMFAGEAVATTERQVFVEMLACVSGCVNGPGWSGSRRGGKLSDILAVACRPGEAINVPVVAADLESVPMLELPLLAEDVAINEEAMQMALAEIGKYSPEDELNCAGCGYQTCRSFAEALVSGKAEADMCVSHMRKLAQKKANALLRYIPAGVVLCGPNLQIIECNRRFAGLFGEDVLMIFDEVDGLKGAGLPQIVPFTDLFETALASGKDLSRSGYHHDGRILDIRIFTVEPHTMVGAIIEDVTEIECRREKIAEKAREVIHKNVMTVQQIAKCLGEHMADTELLLRQVASGFEEVKK